MKILKNCYVSDARKTYHAKVFSRQAIDFSKLYQDQQALEFLGTALKWLEVERNKNYWDRNLRYLITDLRREIEMYQ